MSAVLRLYAAYNITNPVVYDLAIWSYVIAGWHFYSEWLIFGTASYACPVPNLLVFSEGLIVWDLGWVLG